MNKYWEERMLKTLTDAEDLELEFEKTLLALYRDAIKKIQSDIDVFYSKYAEKNQSIHIGHSGKQPFRACGRIADIADIRRLEHLVIAQLRQHLHEILAALRYDMETRRCFVRLHKRHQQQTLSSD